MEYTCDKCGKEFEQKNQLTGHMMSHKKDRKERKSFNSPKLQLKVDTPDGFEDHWFLERELADAGECGYEMVSDRDKNLHIGEDDVSTNTDIGSCVSTIGNRSTGEKLYLMRIDKKYYDEDRAATERINMEVDDAIRGGKVNEGPDEKRYIPSSGITYDP